MTSDHDGQPDRLSPATACWAPFTSLYLDPSGDVQACCMNRWQRLGNVAETSLREIWEGAELDLLRTSLSAGDFSRGCELCARSAGSGDRTAAYLHVYDDLGPTSPTPRWPASLELALSNTCNLQCVMCNGDLSSAIRSQREGRPALPSAYDESFFAELDEFLPHLRRITLLGGEPFLARESMRVMDRLVELELRPACHVTTNATQWSTRIERLLRSLPMHVALSVDALSAETLEAIRVGTEWRRLMENLQRYRSVLAETGGTTSISFCLMRPNWEEFRDVLLWADSMDVDVFVNAVDHPAHLSLRRCSDRELVEIVGSLHRQDSNGQPLGRNRAVWEREVSGLEGLATGRSSTRSVSVSPPRRADRVMSDGADLVAVLQVDHHQMVRSVDPHRVDRLDLDWQALIGGRLAGLQPLLVDALGPIDHSGVQRGAEGEELRIVVFSRGATRTTVRLTTELLPDGGERWSLSVQD